MGRTQDCACDGVCAQKGSAGDVAARVHEVLGDESMEVLAKSDGRLWEPIRE